MEGLSAAGGVFAVVSIAIDLVETIEKIRHFVQKAIDAPTQWQSLIRELELLQLLLQGVKAISEREACYGATVSSEAIRLAVINCDVEVKSLQAYIQSTQSVVGKGKVARTLGAVKFAFKDGDIKDLENDLHHVVSNLHVAMSLHESNVQNRNIHININEHRTTRNEFALLRTDLMSTGKIVEIGSEADDDLGTMKVDTLRSRYALQASRREFTTETRYKGFLGTLCIRQVETTVSFDKDHEHTTNTSSTQKKSSWLIIPTFLSRCFELQFRNTSRTMFQNLEVYHIVDDWDPIWNICCYEKGATFRAYLHHNRHRIDPFIIDSGGHSLLHAAALSRNHETCEVLLQLNIKPNYIIDEDGHDALHKLNPYGYSYPNKNVMPELTLRVFVRYDPECVEGSALRFWDVLQIEDFEGAIEKWVTHENINLIRDSPILCAMRSMTRSQSWPEKLRWIESIQKLVKMGADVHRFAETNKVSLLHEVLALTLEPWDGPEAFNFWILVLCSSGVNITRYLKVEVDFYYDNNCTFIEDWDQYGEVYRRNLTLEFNADGDAQFSWEWFVEPQAPGYELVKEFKHLDAPIFYWCRRDFTGEYKDYKELCEERFQRKQAAKAAKTKGPDEKRVQLPGAWID